VRDIEYLGNCSHLVNFNRLIGNLKYPEQIGPTAKKTDNNISDIIKIWTKAGYKTFEEGGTVKWGMYYPNTSFDEEIIKEIINYVDIPFYNSAWISRIDPGYCAAPHYDRMPVDKTLYRCHVHLEDSVMGQVFYVGKTYITDYKQGDIYMWKDPYSWHAGSNISLKPKFMLNFY